MLWWQPESGLSWSLPQLAERVISYADDILLWVMPLLMGSFLVLVQVVAMWGALRKVDSGRKQ
ncbi:MAG: hypothetical protein P4K86_13800 [Terracidiphilus sp.]|nr:hypothetical protein [Terracidiphilus sp.]MDR3777323.1 hypothetical protein [Terracidiphilus sp.]